jgi:hypothetical protein
MVFFCYLTNYLFRGFVFFCFSSFGVGFLLAFFFICVFFLRSAIPFSSRARSLQTIDADERRSAPSRAQTIGAKANLGQQITVDLSADPFNARNQNVISARHKVQEIAMKYDIPSSFSVCLDGWMD